MRYLILLLIYQFSFADQIFHDKNGFVSCFEKNNQIYFLDWDHLTGAQERLVSYFKKEDYIRAAGHFVKDCDDQKYIQNIPAEILRPIDISNQIFSSDILFSTTQISQGGRTFRSEKTSTEFIKQNATLFQTDSPAQIENLRKNYGDQFAGDVVTDWSNNLFSQNESCEKYIGTCDFYLCQEKKNPCGLDGYNLGFGFKYCSGSKFKLLDQMQTDLGKSWVASVFQCLQKKSFRASETNETRTCDQIKSDAYNSHPDCYVESGFCELKMSEKLKIFKLIKKEIFSAATIRQAKNLLNQCHLLKQEEILLKTALDVKGTL